MTILYVNGDSHSAGAEAVNTFAFAEDDPLYWGLGRQPHPDNIKVSYGCEIANLMGAVLHCDAESASSNDRIIRTTQDYINEGNKPDLVIIGWSTWEREEWIRNGASYHVTASGHDDVPAELKTRYKEWVIKQAAHENYTPLENLNYDKIWGFHLELESQNIKHLFFNTYSCFLHKRAYNTDSMDTKNKWFEFSIDPYRQDMTYYFWLRDNGFNLVNPKWHHYDAEAHKAWANFILPKVKDVLTLNR